MKCSAIFFEKEIWTAAETTWHTFNRRRKVTVRMKEVSSRRKRTRASFARQLFRSQPTERKEGKKKRRIISGDEKDPKWHARTCRNQHQHFIKTHLTSRHGILKCSVLFTLFFFFLLSLKYLGKYEGECRRAGTENAGGCQTRFPLIDWNPFCLHPPSPGRARASRSGALRACAAFSLLRFPSCVETVCFCGDHFLTQMKASIWWCRFDAFSIPVDRTSPIAPWSSC